VRRSAEAEHAEQQGAELFPIEHRQALDREGRIEQQHRGDQKGIEDELIEQRGDQRPAKRTAPLAEQAAGGDLGFSSALRILENISCRLAL
jgi:hypothetical protein